MNRILSITLALRGVLSISPAAEKAPLEEGCYKMIPLPIPPGVILEAGALLLLPEKKIASATRLGDIYIIEGAYNDPPTGVKFTKFASGLHEVLGLRSEEHTSE